MIACETADAPPQPSSSVLPLNSRLVPTAKELSILMRVTTAWVTRRKTCKLHLIRRVSPLCRLVFRREYWPNNVVANRTESCGYRKAQRTGVRGQKFWGPLFSYLEKTRRGAMARNYNCNSSTFKCSSDTSYCLRGHLFQICFRILMIASHQSVSMFFI